MSVVDTGGQARHPADTERLFVYWSTGEGGQDKIKWGVNPPGEPGDFERCEIEINKAITDHGGKPLPPHEIAGMCNELHRRALGVPPGHAPGEKYGPGRQAMHSGS